MSIPEAEKKKRRFDAWDLAIMAMGIALITAACSLAGNYIGSGLAIKKNPAFIRVMLTVVCGLLLVKLGYDVLF